MLALGACGRIDFGPLPGDGIGSPLDATGIAIGTIGDDRLGRVGVDGAGNLYFAGIFHAPIDFGGTAYSPTGTRSSFLVSMDRQFDVRWVQTIDSDMYAETHRLVVSTAGQTYLSGMFLGSVTLPDGIHTSAVGQNLLVASYGADGTFRWANDYGGDWNMQAQSISMARDESRVVVGGVYLSTAPVPIGASFSLSATTEDNPYILSLDDNGNEQWVRRMRSTMGAFTSVVRYRDDGAICRGGHFNFDLDYEPDGAIDVGTQGSEDIYVGMTDSAGLHVWTARLGSTGSDIVYDATSAGDDCVFVGRAGGPIGNDATGGALIARSGADGTNILTRMLGGTSTAFAVAAQASGALLVAGTFNGGWTPEPEGPTYTSVGARDGYVAELAADGSITRMWILAGTGRETINGIVLDGDDMLLTGTFDDTIVTSAQLLQTVDGDDGFVLRVPLR